MTRWKPVLCAIACAAAGCGDDAITLRPVIEVPPNEDAYPLNPADVNELVLAVAEAGDDSDIQLARSGVDDPPSLSGVPFGDRLVLHVSGERGGVQSAYGRSCEFAMPDDEGSELRVYFSKTVNWGTVAVPNVSIRKYGYAIDGGARAVFLGGQEVTDAEVFDARSSGAFLPFQGVAVPERRGAVLAAFANGRAVLVGGLDDQGGYAERALYLDPTGNTLDVENWAGPALVGHAAATLVDDTVVVAGGLGPDGVAGAAYGFVSNPEIDQLNVLGALAIPRADHTMTRLGNEPGADVLIVGGRDDSDAPIQQAELYRPLSTSFEPVGTPSPLAARWGHRAVRMLGGYVLIVGGFDPDPVTTLALYDPVKGEFIDAGQMPAGAGLSDMTVSPLPDGRRVLLAGGLDATGTPVTSTYFVTLDAIDGRVIVGPTDDLELPRAGHTAVRLCDGTILLVGGAGAGAPAERYNPAAEGRR